jgi:hypothetical protein
VNNEQKNAQNVAPEEQRKRDSAEGLSATFAKNATIHLAVQGNPQDCAHPFGTTSFSIVAQSKYLPQSITVPSTGFVKNYAPINFLHH